MRQADSDQQTGRHRVALLWSRGHRGMYTGRCEADVGCVAAGRLYP